MIYRELLVMRKALMWYFIVTLAMCVWVEAWIWMSEPAGSHTSTDVAALAMPIAWSVSFFPAIFGVALGNGSRDAARVLWTLPVERWVLALRAVVVDLGAIVVAFVGTFMLTLLVFAVEGLHKVVELRGSIDGQSVAAALAFLFAVYGWSALAGMLGRRVAYLGIAAYPFLLVWWSIAHTRSAMGELARTAIILNPIAVYSAYADHRALSPLETAVATIGPDWQIFTLAAVFILTIAASVYLWQRAEVLN